MRPRPASTHRSTPIAVAGRGRPGQGGGGRGGGRLRAHGGAGPRRIGHRPGNMRRTSIYGMPGKTLRRWATVARCTTRSAAASPGAPRDLDSSTNTALGCPTFCPTTTTTAIDDYRWDIELRRESPTRRVRGRLAAANVDARPRRPIARSGRGHGNPASRRPCAPRPSCLTSPGRVSPRRGFASSAPRADRPAAGSTAARRRMVGAGHVRAGSRIGFRRPAHTSGPEGPRRSRVPGQGPQDLDHPGALVAVVHPVCPHRPGCAQAPRNLLLRSSICESPGVRIEPIRMASISDETFCEVFLDDVEVPADNLLGTVQRRLERRDVVVAAMNAR